MPADSQVVQAGVVCAVGACLLLLIAWVVAWRDRVADEKARSYLCWYAQEHGLYSELGETADGVDGAWWEASEERAA
jgi:hypothetical protein